MALACSPAPTDASLVERSWSEPEAFAGLFDRHAAAIHRYVARRLGAAVADDLLGETFAIAFAQRRRYDPSREDAAPWLYGIATNLVGGHRRAEARRLRALHRRPQDDALEPMADVVAARVTAQAQRREIAAALGRLPAAQRDVVLLHAWAGLDYAEIADALGIPVGTVRSRLSRARERLQRTITDPGSHP